MILVEKNNQKRNADMNKNTTKRIRIDYATRKIIQRRWNKNIDGGKHESIKQMAESLAIPYTTLRDELKRGCDGGVSCFYTGMQVKSRGDIGKRLKIFMLPPSV